jgi:hypothetical protein
MTVKNDPESTLFGRKTGGSRQKKDIVRSSFLTLGWFVVAQAFDLKEFATTGPVAKKSCLKTYDRFFVLRGL